MKATIEFDLKDEEDKEDYLDKFYSREMMNALWEISTLIRTAAKNDYSAEQILKHLRAIYQDLPEELFR